MALILVMSRLANYFFRGLVLAAPLAITLYVCWLIFSTVDRWLGLPIPGAGFVATITLVTLLGFFASNLLTRGAVNILDRVLHRLPFVRLLYSSTKDLLNAFVGEQRRFDQPVLVTLSPDGAVRALGFITRAALPQLQLEDHVAVYLPQSYNFAGNLIVVPRSRVAPVALESSEVLTFIVSGGVTGIGARGAGAVAR
ncbi:MAG: DUF502 domain-containing protein [Gemmatimonadaceae bacterium]